MKKIFALLMAAAVILTATGCGGNTDSESGSSADNGSSDSSASVVDEKLEEAKKTGAIGEILTNRFFSMSVSEAYKLNSVSGYIPNDPNYEYLCVKMSVISRSAETINVGAYDFEAVWGEEGSLESAPAIEQEDFGFNKYPDSVDIEYLEPVRGNVFFMVPKDAENLQLQYAEVFDTEAVGNIYRIDLGELEYGEDPTATDDGNWVSAAVGEKMSTSVFDMTVNGANTYDELGDYAVDPGYKFLGVNVTMEGTSEEAVETGAYYFSVGWGSGEEDYCFAIEEEAIADLPIKTELAAGDKLEGNVYFVVPEDAEYIDFYYIDIYAEEYSDYTVTLGSTSSIIAA